MPAIAQAQGQKQPVPDKLQPMPDQSIAVGIERAFPNLRFERPLYLTHAGDKSNRVFVVGQLGEVWVFPNDQDVAEGSVKSFLNIRDRVMYKDKENEEGLLGFAFHPKYEKNGYFYVYYTTRDPKRPHTSVISRFSRSKDNPDQADPASEVELMQIPQPFWNHNGGTIVFGPDGYLYVGLGDGGAANDPMKNGQNLSTLLGSMLRIDIDRQDEGKKYAVPKDNPFVNTPNARGEIWAYGLRNVWRMEFDPVTKALWAGDVGQDLWEEIDLIVKGGNYGWNLREGMHAFKNGSGPRKDLIEPIWEYHHNVGKSITGGNVYRGTRVPALVGKYLYADYVTGKVWALDYDLKAGQVKANYKIPGNKLPVMSFGQDEQQETYFMTTAGTLLRFKAEGGE